MATSGSTSVVVTSQDTLKFSWWSAEQSVNNNATTIGWKLELIAASSGYIQSTASKTYSITINGTTYEGTNTIGIANNTTKTLASGTTVIAHNSDGTKSFNYSFTQQIKIYWGSTYIGAVSGEGSATLDAIPRKSSVSAKNGTLGTAQTITVDRKSSNFTHTIMYQCGNESGLICTKYNVTSMSFTPPLSLASQNTTGTQVSVKLTIETFNGNTSIGTDSITITCGIPASVKPSCTIEVIDASGYHDMFDAYVQNKSRFKVNVNATTAYGSKIVSYSTNVEDSVYNGAAITANAVKGSGKITVTTTVKDARGRTGSASVEVDVLAYNAPSISLLKVNRCGVDGKEDAQGEYAVITFTALITSLNSKNEAGYVLEYKKSSESVYTSVSLADYDGNYNPVKGTYIISADSGSTYDIRLTAIDAFGLSARTTSVSTGFATMHWLATGLGAAFGKIAELADYLDVAWNARFRKNVEVDGKLTVNEMGQPILPKDTDLDTLLIPNTYVGGSTSANTYKNLPDNITSDITFLLEVMASGSGGQRMQRFTVCDKTAMVMYMRFYYSGTWGSWNGLNVVNTFEADATYGHIRVNYTVIGKLAFLHCEYTPNTNISSSSGDLTYMTSCAPKTNTKVLVSEDKYGDTNNARIAHVLSSARGATVLFTGSYTKGVTYYADFSYITA